MQRWVVFCWVLVALVAAEECPDGGRCEEGQTCCNDPANGYECCPFDQAECCGDHTHCCPAGTFCDTAKSSCVNATVSIPWVERTSADQPRLSKSFRMIKTYMGEEDDNICPDQSRCPPEFSCLRALTRFGCCPIAQGVPCSDGKHCCPEGHQCSADSRSCIRKELMTTVVCSDGVSECPDQTTCCETPEGKWGCCPMPKAVCCEDKVHCCPEGSSCDVEHSQCISLSTKKQVPMWAKLPARIRAEWENKKEDEQVTAETANSEASHKASEVTTANTHPPSGNDVPCNETVGCPDGTTCCKTKEGGWACCPLPEAVCCQDFIHCCPKGKTCNLAAQTCEGESGSMPWLQKVPVIQVTSLTQTEDERKEPEEDEETKAEETDEEEEKGEENKEVEGKIQCDAHTSCPQYTTCCFMASAHKWGCCPLPEAVCCADGNHCCPTHYKCNERKTSCVKGEVVIPWYTKLPATTSVQADSSSVPCDRLNQCPEHTTCCRLFTGEWGCCPMKNAVCCPDKEHCCPQGYTCNIASKSCQKLIMLQLETVPLTPVYLPEYQPQPGPLKHRAIKCDEHTSCTDEETCCRMSATTWGCCPSPNAVCCSDMKHCCPTGYTCTEGGACTQNTGLHWHNWHVFLANKKRALIV